MLRSPVGLRLHFMRQLSGRLRNKTSVTPITSSTTFSNLQHKAPLPPQRKNMIITRGSTTTRRLVTKTGLLCPSPISGHTDSYGHSSMPYTQALNIFISSSGLLSPSRTFFLFCKKHSLLYYLLLSLTAGSPTAYSLISNT